MSDKAIKLEIKGIQSDVEECDYVDEDVKVIDFKEWLGSPCPKY